MYKMPVLNEIHVDVRIVNIEKKIAILNTTKNK